MCDLVYFLTLNTYVGCICMNTGTLYSRVYRYFGFGQPIIGFGHPWIMMILHFMFCVWTSRGLLGVGGGRWAGWCGSG